MSRKTHTSTEVKDRWNRKNYDSILIRTAKGSRELIQDIAACKGMSVAGYIKHLIIADNPQIIDISLKIGGGGSLEERKIREILDRLYPPDRH